MVSIKTEFYRYKRVIQEVIYLKRNFYNWDVILRRAINGKHTKVLMYRKGLKFYSKSFNTLSIFKEIFIKKVYTSNIVDLQKNDIVFDIGANIGLFSLFASTVGNVKIFAFEPHPENFEVLKANISLNDITNIEALNIALGKENESRYLLEGTIPGGHKILHNSTKNGIEVKTLTLLKVIEDLKIEKIDFLKLDCEGAEGEIIMSLGMDGLKRIKKMAIEFHNNNSALNHDEILEELKKAGFVTSLNWNGSSPFGYIYAYLN